MGPADRAKGEAGGEDCLVDWDFDCWLKLANMLLLGAKGPRRTLVPQSAQFPGLGVAIAAG